ncbi:sodium-translocating pyrophosphatase [Candidatus Microgenomates bacterium]|nr:sodium-translocating pyrophosphatase [Candidatus Microgenomates bacterium]
MLEFFSQYTFPIVLGSAGLAVLYALYLISQIVREPRGNETMIKIADAIYEGANAYLKRQYSVVAGIAALLAVIITVVLGLHVAVGFLLGATLSAAAGIIGMHVSVRANVRVAQAAQKGMAAALNLSFKGGAVTGLLVAGLALLAVTVTFVFATNVLGLPQSQVMTTLVGLGFGGSLISVFARLGGGIFTKAADVGTDMVGKIEKGIPEDDIRNPGVIADQVGDNVGDCAGMAADLFETYVVTAVATMLLGVLGGRGETVITFPLLVGAVALLATIIGTLFVKLPKSGSIMAALYQGLIATVILTAILLFPITKAYFGLGMFVAIIVGFALSLIMVAITEYFTSKKFSQVRNLAQSGETGHATNMIAGLALSLRSTFMPILAIGLGTLIAYQAGGLYGIAVAAAAMLSLTGMVVAIDAFGPITDNAGGIAEMANLPEKTRKVTDALDAVGNTTKAVTKAYAIASAGLAALVLFASYTQELGAGSALSFSLASPTVLVGLFIGGALPYLFASFAMESVGKAAGAVATEIRRQFKEDKGIMKGTSKPDYHRAVDLVTRAALREMITPALLPILVPIIVAFTLGAQALGGLLLGTIVTGLFIGLSMTTGGAAWDNAKKYIEDGHFGGKGSFAHQAAVTGDTVGDPYKDTAGPAINPMIKVANIVALLLAPLLA